MNRNRTVRVPYVDIAGQHAPLKSELLEAAGRVLDHGSFILGPEVGEFECDFAGYCGCRFAVGVSSCTGALTLVLVSLGVGPGDEVITAPNSFLASASSIALTGATPVFADVRDDFNIDPALVEAAVTERTKAIMPVHLTGRPADMDPVMEISKRHGIPVVEDCAQAVGAAYRDRKVGTFGVAGCFSLHPLKTLNAVGDGGVIVTDDPDLYGHLIQARNHGLKTRDECEFWSWNMRLDTLQAAMLLVKLEHLDAWTAARRENASFYTGNLEGVVRVPVEMAHEYSVYHTFVIEAERRDELKEFLASRGVDTKIHYPVPIHLQQAASGLGYSEGSFPVTERQAGRILSLPVHPGLTTGQLEYVVESIREFYNEAGK